MVATFVLIAGVLFVMLVGAIVFTVLGMTHVLVSLIPLAPWLVMVGSVLLIITELLLFLGGKDDRRAALRDLSYLVPTCLVSAGFWYAAQYLFW